MSVFGGSRVQIAGPTGALIVILAGVVAKHGAGGLLLATLMAGVILVAMGLAKFGRAIRFIPDPVIGGFTAGIAVLIWVGQWQDFFGLPKTGGEHVYDKLWQLALVLPRLEPATTGLAAASLLLVVFGQRIPGLARVPGPLIALLAATAVQAAFHLPNVATIGSAFGGIRRACRISPCPRWPSTRSCRCCLLPSPSPCWAQSNPCSRPWWPMAWPERATIQTRS